MGDINNPDWSETVWVKKTQVQKSKSVLLSVPEDPKTKTIDFSFRVELLKARQVRKWTQKQLDQMCNFPINTVKNLETGTVPTSHQRNILQSKLGIKFAPITKKQVIEY